MPAEDSQAVRFHLSLNVADLTRSVQFFQALFATEPAKQRADYAKFELLDPPLVLSLEPHPPGGRGALNHAGFRFPSSPALVEAQRRLELAGFQTQREEGVECCYSRQTKFWAHDPDGGLWEFEAGGWPVTIEESIYLASTEGPRRIEQLVVRAQATNAVRIAWSLARKTASG